LAGFVGFLLGVLSLQSFQIYTKNFVMALIILSALFVCIFSEKITFNKWFTYFGAFVGFMLALILLSFFYSVPLLILCDSLFIILPFMQAFGRLASINNGCCSSNYGVYKNKIVPVHAYEIFFNLILGGFMILLLFYNPYMGVVSSVYLLGYGGIRLFIEPYRNEEKKIFLGKYSLYQMLLTFSFWILGVLYLSFSLIYKIPINVLFRWEYLLNAFYFIPLIFIMSLVVFFTFGVYKKKGENHGTKAY